MDSDTTDHRTADGRAVCVLRNARVPGGAVVDVALADGRVVDVRDPSRSAAAAGELDLTGYVLLPAPAEPHAHLDKAFSWDEIRPPMGDLASAIDAWRAHSEHLTADGIAVRAERAARTALANGTTAIRSHVDLLVGDDPLRGVEALVAVRERLRTAIDIQLVALCPYDVGDAALEAALDAGVDLVGGSPHHTPAPSSDLQRLLRVAERRGVGVDMHTDEQLDPDVLTLEELAKSVRDWPAHMPVTAGHCVSLGVLDAETLERVIAEVRDSRIGVVALPITNLYLQGRQHPVSTPRGLTAVRALLDAGVVVGAGGDNVRDPFNPLGRSDALETAMLLVTAGHVTAAEAYHAVSTGARAVMGLPDAGPHEGAVADLLAVRADGLEDAIASAPADRYVFKAGRLVAASHVRRSLHVPL
ncbi:amidohydrolase family protein [Rhodococcus sp. HNM0569]|uniref:amidohydrolase family protein n=1 Tax=Rhodococcus sp. HNM0569 TaxID=2716340 RepID=UPI00146D3EA2|nr:amidohydrolase family protein [Rhodococcus sp. HNM0569]NLU84316.1 amidohydrolase family protein [Rhodococcus sp. HNM0569]